MTQEEKQLLLKDLCTRLPYMVRFKYKGEYGEEPEPQILFELNRVMVNTHYELEGCKSYLRPMSSMTEEEKEFMEELSDFKCTLGYASDKIEFCLRRHLDYRGLIKKGLAIEAPEWMYDF